MQTMLNVFRAHEVIAVLGLGTGLCLCGGFTERALCKSVGQEDCAMITSTPRVGVGKEVHFWLVIGQSIEPGETWNVFFDRGCAPSATGQVNYVPQVIDVTVEANNPGQFSPVLVFSNSQRLVTGREIVVERGWWNSYADAVKGTCLMFATAVVTFFVNEWYRRRKKRHEFRRQAFRAACMLEDVLGGKREMGTLPLWVKEPDGAGWDEVVGEACMKEVIMLLQRANDGVRAGIHNEDSARSIQRIKEICS